MELYEIVLLVVGIVLLVVMAAALLMKKDYLKYSKLFSPILTAIVGVLKAVGGMFPNSKVLTDVTTVFAAGVEAAGYAENLWLQGEIDKKMRPEYAKQYIKMLLEKAGINVTEEMSAIISGAIAITCYLMPHYTEENKEEE